MCMKLAVQTVNIDLTTDSLNQLLVLQNSFIKVIKVNSRGPLIALCVVLITLQEVNELVQLFISMGDSLPQQRWQPSSSPDNRTDAPRPGLERRDSSSEPSELLSLLDSCQLSIDEICITVSTPLCTALRFSTSRIDMHVMNSGRQPPFPGLLAVHTTVLPPLVLHLHCRYACDKEPAASIWSCRYQCEPSSRLPAGMHHWGEHSLHSPISLHPPPHTQDSSSEDDDFCELAYFRTKISIKNTQQSAPRLSLVGGASEDEASQPLDTFIISIISPHLYIQSSAVEQGMYT